MAHDMVYPGVQQGWRCATKVVHGSFVLQCGGYNHIPRMWCTGDSTSYVGSPSTLVSTSYVGTLPTLVSTSYVGTLPTLVSTSYVGTLPTLVSTSYVGTLPPLMSTSYIGSRVVKCGTNNRAQKRAMPKHSSYTVYLL